MNTSLTTIARVLASLSLAGAAAGAQAFDTAWADWTTKLSTTSVSGTLTLPSGIVKVKFSGPTLYFSQVDAGATDYWVSGSPDAYAATGEPTGSDLLGFVGGTDTQVYKITFSKPVTNPVVAILSLGRNGVPTRYVFTQTPTLLSFGVGFYGGCADCLKVKRKTVTGTEGHGVVQFIGTFSAISWKQPDYEFWHGMTIGAPLAGN
ncbi:hypothetical protein [Ideonella sp.]|uniref:hypothetical protein n=1 Tax=Ideonella sp. TaxID=1929293 RepID=UPI002B45FB2C|nr:hypothetical protein [Ideonella sp.]HJV71098.1 hypothetical protein [Ideonella sp.]